MNISIPELHSVSGVLVHMPHVCYKDMLLNLLAMSIITYEMIKLHLGIQRF